MDAESRVFQDLVTIPDTQIDLGRCELALRVERSDELPRCACPQLGIAPAGDELERLGYVLVLPVASGGELVVVGEVASRHLLADLRVLLPVPIGTEKTEPVVGARVRCSYEGGHLVKRITEIDPRRAYRFDVIEQALVIGGGMTLSGGSYSLRERPDGRTEVAVTTCYMRGRCPAWFWRPVEAAVCHLFHRHLLAAVRRKVEADVIHDAR